MCTCSFDGSPSSEPETFRQGRDLFPLRLRIDGSDGYHDPSGSRRRKGFDIVFGHVGRYPSVCFPPQEAQDVDRLFGAATTGGEVNPDRFCLARQRAEVRRSAGACALREYIDLPDAPSTSAKFDASREPFEFRVNTDARDPSLGIATDDPYEHRQTETCSQKSS